jgi:hypothetical protein
MQTKTRWVCCGAALQAMQQVVSRTTHLKHAHMQAAANKITIIINSTPLIPHMHMPGTQATCSMISTITHLQHVHVQAAAF